MFIYVGLQSLWSDLKFCFRKFDIWNAHYNSTLCVASFDLNLTFPCKNMLFVITICFKLSFIISFCLIYLFYILLCVLDCKGFFNAFRFRSLGAMLRVKEKNIGQQISFFENTMAIIYTKFISIYLCYVIFWRHE